MSGRTWTRLRQIDFSLALDQAERPGDPVKDRAKGKAPAPVTFQGVGLDDFLFAAAAERVIILGAAGEFDRRRIDDLKQAGRVALIDQGQLDLEKLRLL